MEWSASSEEARDQARHRDSETLRCDQPEGDGALEVGLGIMCEDVPPPLGHCLVAQSRFRLNDRAGIVECAQRIDAAADLTDPA